MNPNNNKRPSDKMKPCASGFRKKPCASGFTRKLPKNIRIELSNMYYGLKRRYYNGDPNFDEQLNYRISCIDGEKKILSKDNTRWKGLPRKVRLILKELHDIPNKDEVLCKTPVKKNKLSVFWNDYKSDNLMPEFDTN